MFSFLLYDSSTVQPNSANVKSSSAIDHSCIDDLLRLPFFQRSQVEITMFSRQKWSLKCDIM